jgi:hypothetical protein
MGGFRTAATAGVARDLMVQWGWGLGAGRGSQHDRPPAALNLPPATYRRPLLLEALACASVRQLRGLLRCLRDDGTLKALAGAALARSWAGGQRRGREGVGALGGPAGASGGGESDVEVVL